MNKELLEFKQKFYTDIENIRHIIKYVNPSDNVYKEVAWLNKPKNKDYQKIAFRGITFSSPNFLLKTMSIRDFLYNDANFYCSVANIRQIPLFPFNNTERIIKTKPFFENEFKDYIIEKDLYIDTDLEEKNNNNEDIFYSRLLQYKKLLELLYTNGLLFESAFSGSRGFKTVIKNINDYSDTENIIKKIACFFYGVKYTPKNIIEISKRQDNIFDFSGISIPSKLMKCTNTMVITDDIIRFSMPIYKYNMLDIISSMQQNKYQIFEMYIIFKEVQFKSDYNYCFDFGKESVIYKVNLTKFIKMVEERV